MAEITRDVDEKSGRLRRLSLKEYRSASETPPVGVPTASTVAKLWPVLDHIGGLDALVPPFPKRMHLSESDWAALVRTVQQAAVVAVDAAITAAERHGLLTKNCVFDALAARWSPAFRRADATRVWDMKPATVERAWREILACGINFNQLWKLVSRSQALYQTSQVGRRGYQIRLHDVADAWVAIVARDPEYRRPELSARLRLANERLPSRVFDAEERCVVRYETAGEWRYNL